MYEGDQLSVLPDQRITVTQQLGTSIWITIPSLPSSSFYELRISYPGTSPTLFTMEILPDSTSRQRQLLNTEKIMFNTDNNHLIHVNTF